MNQSQAIVVMGVAGSGKTYVGRRLADRLGCEFFDADDFHPQSNIAKMRDGVPLDDTDRGPWLATLNQLLRDKTSAGHSAVLACSALKHGYRAELAAGVNAFRFVYLAIPESVSRARVAKRRGHFMPPELVASQFDALEPPKADEAIVIDADRPKDEVVSEVIDAVVA